METSPPQAPAAPVCRGLTHRTEAGWKNCMERFRGLKSFSSWEPTSAFQETEEPGSSPNDDEYHHFYYFDGVLRRVQSHVYPYYRRQMNHANTENAAPTDAQENLLSYIKRLALRNKVTADHQEDDVQRNTIKSN